MIFKRDAYSSVLKKLIKLLESQPLSPGGPKANAIKSLSTTILSNRFKTPEIEIRLLNFLSALQRVLTVLETHGIKPDHTINISFSRMRKFLSFAARGKLPQARNENAAALKEIYLAKKQVNSEKDEFIRTIKFDTIYSQLASLFDTAGRLIEPAKKEKS